VDVHENDGTHFALDLPLASDTSLSALRRLACGRLKDREVFALGCEQRIDDDDCLLAFVAPREKGEVLADHEGLGK
jgi:hypothetical protein